METKIVKIGNKVIGGGNPILIQSMTNTKTENVADTVAQINALTDLGCDIIRCAVPTMEAARALKDIKKQISIPLVADIHFDYKLAIAAIENGADKIRINPGNIGSAERVNSAADTQINGESVDTQFSQCLQIPGRAYIGTDRKLAFNFLAFLHHGIAYCKMSMIGRQISSI